LIESFIHSNIGRMTQMRYRPLGGTGIQVSAYCLGAMMFGLAGNSDRAECQQIVDTALDAGINFIDTADMYSHGESEEIVGDLLRARRDEVILATKFHFPMGEGPNRSGNSRRWIIRALDDSLRRLQTDWIDLYQVHRPDPCTDITETLSVLSDLTSAGKIRAFGCSTFPAEQIIGAHAAAERRGLPSFRTEQAPYSLLARGVETSVLPVCQRSGMGVLTWSPLAGGFLSGKYRSDQPVNLSSGRAALQPERFDPAIAANAAKLALADQLAALAQELGITLPTLALAFPLTHPAVTSVIVGPRTPDQLQRILGGANLTLNDATLDRIDQIVPPGVDHYQVAWRPAHLDEARTRRRPDTDRAAIVP
jgi:aryl-alcohol dehydrogenase-like predicted oxidoreductase